MHTRKTSVAVIVIVALVAMTTLVLGTLGVINYSNAKNRELEMVRAALALDADQIAPSLDLPVWNFDRQEVDKVVESMMLDPILRGVVVQLTDDKSIISARQRDAQGNIKAIKEDLNEAELLVEKRDITFAHETLATATLYGSTDAVDVKMKGILRWTVFNIVSLDLILILGLYLLLHRWVFQPLQEVEAYAATVSAGGNATRIHIFHGELESLRSSIETMIGQLEARHNQLQAEITERKRTEEVLREKQAQLFLAMDIAKLAHWEFDVAANLVTGDENIFHLLGTTSEQQGGLSMSPQEYIRKFVHPLDADKVAREVALGVTTTDPNFARQFEHRIIRADGSEGVLMVRSRITKGASGQTMRICGTNQDITEQKRAEAELLGKTAFLEAQVDSALDGILVVDDRTRRILQNQHLLQLFNVPDEIARDDDDTSLLRHVTAQMKNPKQFAERVAWLYAQRDEIGRDEIELIDGRILDRYSAPVRDNAGKYYGRIWTFRDITAQRKLEEQLRQAQKMEAIGQLASGVAHDFNNILAAIQMQAGLMQMEEGMSPAQTEHAVEIEKASQRAANLTRQLLLFSRQQAMQLRDLDLNQIISNVTKMLQRILGENVQMQFKYAKQPVIVHADASMIDQVLMNLVVNARDAMPNGGNLFVETSVVEFDDPPSSSTLLQSRSGTFVCLSVSDTGCGISPEIKARIFEPFFTTKGVGEGTGLGLATVFGIVQQHQGWIDLYSEFGHGATFRIYLPQRTGTVGQTAVKKTQISLPGGHETILLVEDDQALRQSMQQMLVKLGYHTFVAATALSALEVWKHRRTEINLLLTDLMMPDGMNGKELARRLLQENPNLKVIYMSGYSADIADQDLPLDEGVNFLAKPVDSTKFAQTIRARLDASV